MMEFKEYIILNDDDDEILENWNDYLYNDYITFRLVDKITNHIIMEGDNYHNSIEHAIDSFLAGVAYAEGAVNIDRYIMMPDGTEKYCYTNKF